jgi:pilus assembly protein CpaB
LNNRRLLIIAAGVLAVFAVLAFVVLAFSNKPITPMRNVVVAARNIPPRSHLNAAEFILQQKPADQVDPAALGSLDGVAGMVSQVPIDEGGVVTAADIAPASSLGLAVQLRQGMRALSIAVDPVKDVSDLLHPGDRVDIIASPPRENGGKPAAFTIMRNIVVLSVGPIFVAPPAVVPQASGAPAATPAPPVESRTVTLEVSPHQADLLTMADLNTTLRLALRPPNEPPTSGLSEAIVFATASPQPVTQPVGPAPRPAGPVGVPVINGDQYAGTGTR